jgi:LysM repeat protein
MNQAPDEKGRSRRGIAAACAFAILLVSQVAFARATEPAEMLLVPVPGNADPSTTLKPAPQDITVLSRLTIQKGDSLWRISRRALGRGAYYPQILAVNPIENPDRIYEGRSLLMPAGTLAEHPELAARLAGKTTTVVFPAPAASPPARAGAASPALMKSSTSRKAKAMPAAAGRKENGNNGGEETETLMIVEWARQGQCDRVIAAADRFLARHPDSTRLSTVLWHQGECYRTMSNPGQ